MAKLKSATITLHNNTATAIAAGQQVHLVLTSVGFADFASVADESCTDITFYDATNTTAVTFYRSTASKAGQVWGGLVIIPAGINSGATLNLTIRYADNGSAGSGTFVDASNAANTLSRWSATGALPNEPVCAVDFNKSSGTATISGSGVDGGWLAYADVGSPTYSATTPFVSGFDRIATKGDHYVAYNGTSQASTITGLWDNLTNGQSVGTDYQEVTDWGSMSVFFRVAAPSLAAIYATPVVGTVSGSLAAASNGLGKITATTAIFDPTMVGTPLVFTSLQAGDPYNRLYVIVSILSPTVVYVAWSGTATPSSHNGDTFHVSKIAPYLHKDMGGDGKGLTLAFGYRGLIIGCDHATGTLTMLPELGLFVGTYPSASHPAIPFKLVASNCGNEIPQAAGVQRTMGFSWGQYGVKFYLDGHVAGQTNPGGQFYPPNNDAGYGTLQPVRICSDGTNFTPASLSDLVIDNTQWPDAQFEAMDKQLLPMLHNTTQRNRWMMSPNNPLIGNYNDVYQEPKGGLTGTSTASIIVDDCADPSVPVFQRYDSNGDLAVWTINATATANLLATITGHYVGQHADMYISGNTWDLVWAGVDTTAYGDGKRYCDHFFHSQSTDAGITWSAPVVLALTTSWTHGMAGNATIRKLGSTWYVWLESWESTKWNTHLFTGTVITTLTDQGAVAGLQMGTGGASPGGVSDLSPVYDQGVWLTYFHYTGYGPDANFLDCAVSGDGLHFARVPVGMPLILTGDLRTLGWATVPQTANPCVISAAKQQAMLMNSYYGGAENDNSELCLLKAPYSLHDLVGTDIGGPDILPPDPAAPSTGGGGTGPMQPQSQIFP